jgi:hypothetical protein
MRGRLLVIAAQIAALQLRAIAARVAFVEDQIEDVQDRGKPLPLLAARRQTEGDST